MNADQQRALDYLLNAITEYRCSGSESDRQMLEQRWQEWRAALPGESAEESLIPTTGD